MTPKEKAQELINKMLLYSEFIYDAQKNALIAVNEILSIKLLWYQKDTKELDYWNEVKKEIEQL